MNEHILMEPLPSSRGIAPNPRLIFTVRGRRVILDTDLADLYGASTKQLNQQVRRNPERFPEDFAFLLTQKEWSSLRLQIATLKAAHGRHRKYLPYVFTEHGALMAANVLNSPRAIHPGRTHLHRHAGGALFERRARQALR